MRVSRSIYGTFLAAMLLIGCVTNARADLVGLWRFDSDVSPQPDASGNNGNAEPINDVTWVNDLERGGVMEFDGQQQYLEVEDSDALSVEGPITIAAWANFATFDTWNGIVTKGGEIQCELPGAVRRIHHARRRWSSQFLRRSVMNGGIAQVFSDVAPELETWQHIAVTWNEDGEVVHYLNGEINGDLGFIDMEAFPPIDADQPLYIGARQDFVTNMTGRLDDVAIFNEALSDLQILDIMGGDFSAWGVGGGLTGDFNGDGMLDAADIDDLTAQSASNNNDLKYDLNSDAIVDVEDVNVWVKDLFNTWIGDATLDGEFNSSDLVAVLSAGKYEVDEAAVWTSGDFNGDGRANSSDLVAALADGGYELGPKAAVAAVPEPASVVLLLIGCLGLMARRR